MDENDFIFYVLHKSQGKSRIRNFFYWASGNDFQTLHQHVSTVALTYITYYSAHKIVPPYDVLYVVIFGFSPVYDFPIDDYNTSSGKIQY